MAIWQGERDWIEHREWERVIDTEQNTNVEYWQWQPTQDGDTTNHDDDMSRTLWGMGRQQLEWELFFPHPLLFYSHPLHKKDWKDYPTPLPSIPPPPSSLTLPSLSLSLSLPREDLRRRTIVELPFLRSLPCSLPFSRPFKVIFFHFIYKSLVSTIIFFEYTLRK